MTKRGPTLRAQLLGQRLRELREEAQLTLRDVGEYVHRDASTVCRFESGLLPARVPEVLAYLDLCGVDDPERRNALKRLSLDVFQKGWWDGYVNDVAPSLIDRIWLETRANEIRTFQALVIPGLLQTRDYTDTVLRANDPDASESQIRRWVEVRMARQQLLTRQEPVRLAAIIDEAALRRTVGGAEAMRAQLLHLSEVARKRHVDIHVLPADAGAHASPAGTFEVFVMSPPYPNVGYVSTPGGDICVESNAVGPLQAAYDRILRSTLGQKDAIAFIEELAREMT